MKYRYYVSQLTLYAFGTVCSTGTVRVVLLAEKLLQILDE